MTVMVTPEDFPLLLLMGNFKKFGAKIEYDDEKIRWAKLAGG